MAASSGLPRTCVSSSVRNCRTARASPEVSGIFAAFQRGTVNVVAIELAGPAFCDSPLGVGFAGTARVLYTDSDVFVSGNRADASQIQVTGTVTDGSGQRYHLLAINVRVIAPGSTPDNPVDLNARAQIRLTPVGG